MKVPMFSKIKKYFDTLSYREGYRYAMEKLTTEEMSLDEMYDNLLWTRRVGNDSYFAKGITDAIVIFEADIIRELEYKKQ